MDNARLTINYDEIREWADKYGGKPQILDDLRAGSDRVGLRIDFPTSYDDRYLPESKVRYVSWDEFFKIFEDSHLAFMYIDILDLSNPDSVFRAYQFISRDVLGNKSEEERRQILEDFEQDFVEYTQPLKLFGEKQ
jgi:hypothetical protein